jgi:hypothetical protein
LVLIVIVLVLHEGKQGQPGGFFSKFQQAVSQISGGSQAVAA